MKQLAMKKTKTNDKKSREELVKKMVDAFFCW